MKRTAALLISLLAVAVFAGAGNAQTPAMSPDLDGDGLLTALDNPQTGGLITLFERGPAISVREFLPNRITAAQCNIYWPASGHPCSDWQFFLQNESYAWTVPNQWKASSSYARRQTMMASIWGPCLQDGARFHIQYSDIVGNWPPVAGDTLISEPNACYVNHDWLNTHYVKIRGRISGNANNYRWAGFGSWWY